ncbi:MAG: hypothetical protein LBM60_00835 [Clostridium sp.]|jgi:hypothetical protein|nr:hypothetical protein [Clostridium sp.]
MKWKKKITVFLRISLCLCALYGWWGVVYPQYSMTPDTYRIVSEDGTVQEDDDLLEWRFSDDVYQKALEANPDQVRFKSKIWMLFKDLLSKFS